MKVRWRGAAVYVADEERELREDDRWHVRGGYMVWPLQIYMLFLGWIRAVDEN